MFLPNWRFTFIVKKLIQIQHLFLYKNYIPRELEAFVQFTPSNILKFAISSILNSCTNCGFGQNLKLYITSEKNLKFFPEFDRKW